MSDDQTKHYDLVKTNEALKEAERMVNFDNFAILIRFMDVFKNQRDYFEYLVYSFIYVKRSSKFRHFDNNFNFFKQEELFSHNESILYKVLNEYVSIFANKNKFNSNNSAIQQIYDYELWITFKEMLEHLKTNGYIAKNSNVEKSLFHELMMSTAKYHISLIQASKLSNEYNPFYYFLEEKNIIPIESQFMFYNLSEPYLPLLDKLLANKPQEEYIDIFSGFLLQRNIYTSVMLEKILSEKLLNEEQTTKLLERIVSKVKERDFETRNHDVFVLFQNIYTILTKYNLDSRISLSEDLRKSLEASFDFFNANTIISKIDFMPSEPVVYLLLSRLDNKAYITVFFDPKKQFYGSGIKLIHRIDYTYNEQFLTYALPKIMEYLSRYSNELSLSSSYSNEKLTGIMTELEHEFKRLFTVFLL